MTRTEAIEDLYQGLGILVRRARDRGGDLHPGLTLVAYTLLTQIDLSPDIRAADLASHFGLDKSTVSRQLDQLIAGGLLRRAGERQGRRGQALVLTAAGRRRLAVAADALRCRLAEWLSDWDGRDIVAFAELVDRFNDATI